MLVATVYLFDVVDAARALGTHGGYQQGDTRTDIGARHATTSKRDLTVVTYDDGTVRVAENNLRTHIDEFVDKEQATLKHLLVE
jgi:hypothetical protein